MAAAIVAAIIVGLIYFGRDVLVPIALAILLSFVLAPIVRTLQNWHLPRGFSVITVVLLAFAVMFAAGGIVTVQVTQLAADLPRYQSTIHAKIESLRAGRATSGPLERAAEMLEDFGREINRPVDGRLGRPLARSEQETKPVPVEVRQPPAGLFEGLSNLISSLLHPLATTGIIFIFVIFILLQQDDLRNRVIKLAGSHDLHKTTAALDDAGRRLSRLLLTQLAVNTAFGGVIGTGLWIIGVPSPVVWGILSGILRFVPYIGAFIAAVIPLTLAIAVDPGWSLLVLTGILFLTVESLLGYLIEPLLYGHSSGLSPVALVVSATFWASVWGPIGLVLAAPMTICLVVMGRHVERLKFLDVMLGDEPPLSPPEMFYQQILAGDPAEEIDRAEKFLKEQPLSTYYDDIALKGLKLAQYDLTRGSLDPSRIDKIRAAVGELIDDLAEQQEGPDDSETTGAIAAIKDGNRLALERDAGRPVLCIAGRTHLDECAALMLAQLLAKHGLSARVEGPDRLLTSNIDRLDTMGAGMVCLSYLDTSSPAHMRYAIRRLRRRLPRVKVLLGCWLFDGDTTQLGEQVKVETVAATLRDAVRHCLEAIKGRDRACA